MIITDIQDNILKAKNAVLHFEDPYNVAYRVYKTAGGFGHFEMECRNIYNDSVTLRNLVVQKLQAMIRATKDRELIKFVDEHYFDIITKAIAAEKPIRLFFTGAFSLPATASKMVIESKEMMSYIEHIAKAIQEYNHSIQKFRQNRNKIIFAIYHIPRLEQLPKPIESSITLHSLMEIIPSTSTFLEEKPSIPPPPPPIISPPEEAKSMLRGKILKK